MFLLPVLVMEVGLLMQGVLGRSILAKPSLLKIYNWFEFKIFLFLD